MGRDRTGQPQIYQCDLVDSQDRGAVEGLAARLRGLEKHTPEILPMAGQGHVGKSLGNPDSGTGFRVADHRCEPLQSSPPRIGSQRRQSGDGAHKRGLNTKIHLAVDAHGLPVRVIVTDGPTADCTQAESLMEGIDAQYLLADKGYDSNAIIQWAETHGMEPVIPAKSNRKVPRDHDKYLYKMRFLVETAFLQLKRWRSIATRYAKNTASFLSIIQIRCIVLWLNIS